MEREVEYQLLLFVDNFPIMGENKAAACAVLVFFFITVCETSVLEGESQIQMGRFISFLQVICTY